MKENKLQSFWIVAFMLATFPFVCSCSNECIEEEAGVSVSVQKASDIVKKQFEDFLEHSTESRSNTFDNADWNFDNIFEASNSSESLYVYMMPDKNNPDNILGGCSIAPNIISAFFTFEKNGDFYTLADEQGKPIVDVGIDEASGEVIFVKKDLIESRANAEAWCGLGMAAVGGTAGKVMAITGWAGVGFAVCWTVVSYLMCKDV